MPVNELYKWIQSILQTSLRKKQSMKKHMLTALVLIGGLLLAHGIPLQKTKSSQTVNIPPEQEGSKNSYESDIILTPEDRAEMGRRGRFRRKAVENYDKLWPAGIIPYQFSTNVDGDTKSKIMGAIRHWEDTTCLKFTPATHHADRVVFMSSPESFIGRRGGAQTIEISQKCKVEMGSIAHEIGHAAGFYHEHSRPDRDDHINVIKKNIQTGHENDFQKYGLRTVKDMEPYDVSSVMHYGLTYFSKNEKLHTLEPKDMKLQKWLGQRLGLSFVDVRTANELYNCSSKCSSSIVCKNNGFIGPRCACVCPDGLTGIDCTDVVKGTTACGGVLTSRRGTITTPGYPHKSYDSNTECNWLIQGQKGSRITLTFDDFEIENDDLNRCDWDSVEIRTYGPHLRGQRYCGEERDKDSYPKRAIIYDGESLFIRLKSDDSNNFKGFRATYIIN